MERPGKAYGKPVPAATAPQGIKAKPLAAPAPLGIKPLATDPAGDDKPTIKPPAMKSLDKM
jgi:hypothetical protein